MVSVVRMRGGMYILPAMNLSTNHPLLLPTTHQAATSLLWPHIEERKIFIEYQVNYGHETLYELVGETLSQQGFSYNFCSLVRFNLFYQVDERSKILIRGQTLDIPLNPFISSYVRGLVLNKSGGNFNEGKHVGSVYTSGR